MIWVQHLASLVPAVICTIYMATGRKKSPVSHLCYQYFNQL